MSKKWKIILAAILLFLAYLCFYKPRTVESAMKSDPGVRGYVMEFHDDHILVGVLPDDDLYETYPVLWVSRNTELYGGRTTFLWKMGSASTMMERSRRGTLPESTIRLFLSSPKTTATGHRPYRPTNNSPVPL